MRVSATTRGLAVTAVAALAVAGLQGPASATSIATQVGDNNVVLYSQFNTGNQASLKADGTDSTIHLEAGAGSNITAISFSYSINGTGPFVPITTVTSRNADGTFAFEWNASAIAGSSVTLRASGIPSGSTTPVNQDRTGVSIQGGGTTDNTVNITDGTTLPYFQQPYPAPNNTTTAVISGTTSATSGTVALSRRGNTGAVDGPVATAAVTAATGAATGTFKGVLDLTGYTFDTNPTPSAQVNQVVVGAERDTDDTEAFTLKRQVITTVTATANNAQIPAGGTANVTVTVTDADGKPVAGAQVLSSSPAADEPKYTDANGQAVITQPAGTEYYYANADAVPAYSDAAGDKRSADVTVGSFNPTPTTLKATSVDGAAFDVDENAVGDISVQVTDQSGANVATTVPRTVQYFWTLTPFDGSPASVRFPATGSSTATTDLTGKANIPLPTGAGVEDGTYVLNAGLQANLQGNEAIPASNVLTVKAGQAAITYTDASPQQAVAGGTSAVNGKLGLADGTGLAGRVVNLTYTPGTEAGPAGAGDSGLVQSNGTTLGTTLAVTTTAAGVFTATVKDPTENPQPTETGGDLDAATGTTTGIGNAGATRNDQKVNFLTSVTAGQLTIAPETPLVTGLKTPARPVSSSVTVRAADGSALANQTVTLTTDKGFFTPYSATFGGLTADPAPAVGADAGEFRSLGTTTTVTTDANGVANFTVAIEKDTGFDDDGRVDATVTATQGTLSDTEVVDWSSASPYNGGATQVVLSPDSVQESSVTPQAPTTDRVFFDVFTTDQFGNRVGGQTVTLSDDALNADISATTVTSDFAAQGDFFATSSAAVDQVITGSWTAPTNKYATVPTGAAPTVATGTEVLTGTGTVNWYAVDFAASTYALSNNASGTVPVGTTVTETYTATDQNGEPISGLFVQFFRTGAGAANNGQPAFEGLTGQDGRIDFVFQGSAAGTARIQVVGREGTATANVVPSAAKSDTVTFGAVTPPKSRVNAAISGKSQRNQDRITIRAGKANGAVVRLFTITNGKANQVAQGRLNNRGIKTFSVRDRNGNRVTQYAAVVSATGDTRSDTTRVVRVR